MITVRIISQKRSYQKSSVLKLTNSLRIEQLKKIYRKNQKYAIRTGDIAFKKPINLRARDQHATFSKRICHLKKAPTQQSAVRRALRANCAGTCECCRQSYKINSKNAQKIGLRFRNPLLVPALRGKFLEPPVRFELTTY